MLYIAGAGGGETIGGEIRIKGMSVKQRLKKAGIRHFDELIHDQSADWLIRHFGSGADEYPVNVALMMRNIIWQARERIAGGAKPMLRELVRTFWYMFVKPTLSRAGALAEQVDQYKQMVEQIVFMTKDLQVMRYGDIGFRDENQAHRKVGGNANIILFSEKLGHQGFLDEMAEKYRVSVIALGGQPSVMNIEYFCDDLKRRGVNPRRSFYLFSVVDFDPSGWIIRDAFLNNLRFYGIKNIRCIDLVNPDMLTADEIRLSRYRIPTSTGMGGKNRRWLKRVAEQDYKNAGHLVDNVGGNEVLYGLEAESISSGRLAAALERHVEPLLGKSEDLLKVYELRKLEAAIKDLILHLLTSGVVIPGGGGESRSESMSDTDFIKSTSVKAFVKNKNFRFASGGLGLFESAFNALMAGVLEEGAALAAEDGRKTVLERDIKTALDRKVAKADLAWDEILHQVVRESPADLGKITAGIRDFIDSKGGE